MFFVFSPVQDQEDNLYNEHNDQPSVGIHAHKSQTNSPDDIVEFIEFKDNKFLNPTNEIANIPKN